MSGSFTYASFAASGTRAGGWGIGDRSGDIPDAHTAAVIPLIPTRISGADTLPTFPDRDELARRIRRFAWLPAPWDTVGTGVLLASAAAGQDASGRPGNVFTCAFITDAGDLPALGAAALLYSPTVPAPFGKRKVDAATVPALADLAPSGLLDATVVERFLTTDTDAQDAGLPAEFGQVRAPSGPASRTGILEVLRDLITAGRQVVLLTDPAEGPLWVAALARVVPRDLPGGRTFTWSTYERAPGVSAVLDLGTSFCVVPAEDRDQLRTGSAVTVVDAAAPLPEAVPVDPVAPVTAAPAGTGATDHRWHTARDSAPMFRTGPRIRRAKHAREEPGQEPAVVQADAPAAAPTAVPAPAPAPEPSLPEGFVTGIVPFTAADAHFISTATLNDWCDGLGNFDPIPGDAPRPAPRPVEHYLFLGPAQDPEGRVRTMILAVLSFGDRYIDVSAYKRFPEQALLCIRSRREYDRLVDKAAQVAAETPLDQTPMPATYGSIRDNRLKDMAALVHQRYLETIRTRHSSPGSSSIHRH